MLNGILCNFDRILVLCFRVNRHPDLFAKHFQLLYRGGTIDVTGYQQRVFPPFALQHVGQLAGEGGLTRSLKARHKNDGGTALDVDLGSTASHQDGQFIVHDLHHHLLRLHGVEHILPHRLLLDGLGELFGGLIVYVGIQQRAAYLFQGLGHVDLGNLALPF